MKFSHKLSDAIHLLSYLVIYKNDDLSSRAIAASIETNPSTVRSLMMNLKQAGLIDTRQGSATPELAKKPEDITMYDVFYAVDMDHELLHIDTKTEPKCIVGGNIQNTLKEEYGKVQNAALQEMKKITLQEIIDDILVRQSKKAVSE